MIKNQIRKTFRNNLVNDIGGISIREIDYFQRLSDIATLENLLIFSQKTIYVQADTIGYPDVRKFANFLITHTQKTIYVQES